MACVTCNDLHHRDAIDEHKSIKIPMQKCLRSAQSTGCDTCCLLRDIVKHFHVDGEDSIDVFQPRDGSGTLKLGIYADLDEDDIILDLFTPEDQDPVHPLIGESSHIRRVMPTSNEDESFNRIRQWNDECDEEHDNCNCTDMAPLPTRVIDVGLDGEDPFLWETNGKPEWYATLSYCWGKTPQLKLTKATLETFKEALPMENLSLVAQDAIDICRSLTIPYLWIDALCILQDDEEDWAREAAQMCDVYSSSYLTIAAAATRDNADGIYQSQYYGASSRFAAFPFRGGEVFARISPFQDHLGHPLGVNFDQQYSTGTVREKSWLLRADELTLASRAWTVQERLLSRRVLYYTQDELWWECDSHWYCECGYANEEKYPAGRNHAEHFRSLDSIRIANRGSFGWLRDPTRLFPLTLDEAYRFWNHLTVMFAAGHLTYEKDKLPALSGLAHQFSRVLKDRFDLEDVYLAGIWKRNLERQLLWAIATHVLGTRPLGSRQDGNTIPTWSWASVQGNVQYIDDNNTFQPRLRVVSASVELSGIDWAGPIGKGNIVVEAFVVHGLRLKYEGVSSDPTASLRNANPKSEFQFQRDTADRSEVDSFSCLYVADYDSAEGVPERLKSGVGNIFLVLQKIEEAGEGSTDVYGRVGIGIASLASMTEGLWDAAKKETITII